MSRIVRIDAVLLEGKRPRPAGSNARLGYHGEVVRLPFVRLTTDEGVSGIGRGPVDEARLSTVVGRPLDQFVSGNNVVADAQDLELPLLDLAAREANQPGYQFITGGAVASPLPARSYDTSLYFDDLHLEDDAEAAALLADEARFGYDRGHRAFKIKVGRGARHLPLEAGTVRDIAIIHAVREAVGADATIMIDANNGWNLNLTKRVLTDTADANLYWIEEAFHEDNVLYEDLQAWLDAEGIPVLIADGEGAADARVVPWAREGLIDVVQTNIFARGLGNWRVLADDLHTLGVQSSPHTYGGGISNYISAQLASSTPGVQFVEWDEASFEELDASGYQLVDGEIVVPATPGLGLDVVEDAFMAAVAAQGVTLIAE
jgi:L-alanine-DL-glutamate epimerase-like enolase superfamily enzyme